MEKEVDGAVSPLNTPVSSQGSPLTDLAGPCPIESQSHQENQNVNLGKVHFKSGLHWISWVLGRSTQRVYIIVLILVFL